MGYGPIDIVNASGETILIDAIAEAATQTFKRGVPLRLSSGTLVECDSNDPWGAADVVVGVSVGAGKNLTTADTAEEGYSIGAPVNQANAKTIPVGVPVKLGKCSFFRADGKNVFEISLKSGQTFATANIVAGSFYTLKKDGTTGFWYLDSSDTTGNNAVATIVGVNPNDSTKVRFQFKSSQRLYA